jgi:hypothetical protein
MRILIVILALFCTTAFASNFTISLSGGPTWKITKLINGVTTVVATFNVSPFSGSAFFDANGVNLSNNGFFVIQTSATTGTVTFNISSMGSIYYGDSNCTVPVATSGVSNNLFNVRIGTSDNQGTLYAAGFSKVNLSSWYTMNTYYTPFTCVANSGTATSYSLSPYTLNNLTTSDTLSVVYQ